MTVCSVKSEEVLKYGNQQFPEPKETFSHGLFYSSNTKPKAIPFTAY